MRGLFIFVLVFALSFGAVAQLSTTDRRFIRSKEDSLKVLANKIIFGKELKDRFLADSQFTRTLVRALVRPYSFDYSFDSLVNISRLYSPDSSFKIFTWNLVVNENQVRQHGAIQMRTADGSFKPFVLQDKSDVIVNVVDTITDHTAWPGAIYYRILKNDNKGRIFYTLLGFDLNNIRTDKKVMDILEFVNGKPQFGAKIFQFEKPTAAQKDDARFFLEFKKEASARLSFDPEYNMIIFDELVSEEGKPNQKWTLVPDGEYEGFKWINGYWVHTTKPFGDGPVKKYSADETIRDNQGNFTKEELKPQPAPPARSTPPREEP